MSGLKVFSNDYDWYVAESVEHAIEMWEEWTREDRADYDDDDWKECDPDKYLPIIFEDFFDMKPFPVPRIVRWWRHGEYGLVIQAKIGDWGRVSKPGFLASTEW